MALDFVPNSLVSLYQGLGSLGAFSLVPGAYAPYIEYFNPSRYGNDYFAVDGGTLDISYDDESLSFDLQDLNFRFNIPEYVIDAEAGPPTIIAASSAQGILNGSLVLNGSYNEVNKGVYTSARLSGTVSGNANLFGSATSFNTIFATASVGIGVEFEGRIIPSPGSQQGKYLDLNSVSLSYSDGETDIIATARGRFLVKRNRTNISINEVDLSYTDSEYDFDINIDLSPGESYQASFFENQALVGRISGTSLNSLVIELNPSLLSRFNITDALLNSLLAGQTISVSGQQASNFSASLGRSGYDLDPTIAFDLNDSEQVYTLESALKQFAGFESVDVKLITPAASGGGGGGGGTGVPPQNKPSLPPQANANPPSQAGPNQNLPGKAQAQNLLDRLFGDKPLPAGTPFELDKPVTLGNKTFSKAAVSAEGVDRVIGSDTAELIAGGPKKDFLSGKGGADGFLFALPNQFGKAAADVITDFNPKKGDRVIVSPEAFPNLKNSTLATASGGSELKQASRGKSSFIFDDKKEGLFYNENGKKPGFGEAGGLFAILENVTDLPKNAILVA